MGEDRIPILELLPQQSLLLSGLEEMSDVAILLEGSATLGPDPRILYVNEAFVGTTGFSRAQAIGAPLRILHGPKTQPEALERIAEALRTGGRVRTELIHYRNCGEEYWTEVDIVPVTGGGSHAFLAVQRDITERKSADADLRERIARLESMLEATSESSWDVDLHTNRLVWIKAPEVDLGFTFEELSQGPQFWFNQIHPEDRPGAVDHWEHALRTGKPGWTYQYRVISKDGTIVHLRDKGRILRDEAGHPVRVIGSTRDVSLEHDLAEKAALAQKMAAVGKLTGGIAHEFNNLLTVVMGNAEALLDELSPQDPKFGAVDLVAQAARKGAQLTNRLLAFASRQSLDPEIVDPNDVIAETMGLIKRLYSPEMEIVSQLADDLWPIYTDATQLQTALLNLVLNSQEAMPEGGSLWVQTENVVIKRDGVPFVAGATAGDYVAISVRDCGVGMPDEVIKKAFDPFFTTKGSTRNSGLGLSSVYGFVKQSNGFIRIDSVAGKGTTVTLYFPRSELLQPDTSAIDRPAGPSPERILVVEDDPMVLEFAVAQIASLGYCLEKATSGRQALAFFEKGERFDLLLTDIVMPGMDGVQLAERAEQLQPGLRVLYASGYNEKAGFASLKTDKPFRLLQKPYTRRHLAKKIREIFMSS